MKKYLPFMLLLLGIIFVIGALLATWMTGHQQAFTDVPPTVAGLTLTSTQGGQAGLNSINQLHGLDLPVKSGVVATYGQDEAVLWVADTGSESAAMDMLQNMETKIAAGNSSFKPMGVYQFQKRDVYLMSGNNQIHFYAQSGSKVFWLSVATEKAEQAMKDLLAFFP